jgi:hypothetical protein
MKLFKRKTRPEVIDSAIENIMHELLINEFSNSEIATILIRLRTTGKQVLIERKVGLEKELLSTTNAINSL